MLAGMDEQRQSGLSAAWIAAAAGGVPLLAVHVCLLISIAVGHVDPCLPYVDGGTSISRACRTEPAVHIFRALVLPSAAVIAATWWIVGAWLKREGLGGKRARRWIMALGVIAALFLVLYAAILGTQGQAYRLMRRYGVYVFFAGTGLAELILTMVLARSRPPALEAWVRRAMFAACALMIAAGPLNLFVERVIEEDRAACFFEWWFALAMIGYLLLLARVWRRAGCEVGLMGPDA
jgi:hypothetical protein